MLFAECGFNLHFPVPLQASTKLLLPFFAPTEVWDWGWHHTERSACTLWLQWWRVSRFQLERLCCHVPGTGWYGWLRWCDPPAPSITLQLPFSLTFFSSLFWHCVILLLLLMFLLSQIRADMGMWTNTLSLQPEVVLRLTPGFPGPFHIVLRYTTPRKKGRKPIKARILVVDEAGFQSCCNCKWRVCLPLPLFFTLLAIRWVTRSVSLTSQPALTLLLMLHPHRLLKPTPSQSAVSFSSLQSEVRVTLHVDQREGMENLFRVVLRFINPSRTSVTGSIKAIDNRGTAGKVASDPESAFTFHHRTVKSNPSH